MSYVEERLWCPIKSPNIGRKTKANSYEELIILFHNAMAKDVPLSQSVPQGSFQLRELAARMQQIKKFQLSFRLRFQRQVDNLMNFMFLPFSTSWFSRDPPI